MNRQKLQKIAADIANLLEEKDEAYGSAFAEVGNVINIMYPEGVHPDQYQDMLVTTRILDKLFRIAHNKEAFQEDPWKDIAGYAILQLWSANQ